MKNLFQEIKAMYKTKTFSEYKLSLSDVQIISAVCNVSLDKVKALYNDYEYNIAKLASVSQSDLVEDYGFTLKQSFALLAMYEFARRRASATFENRNKITSSKDVFALMHQYLQDANVEMFYALYLNRANHVLSITQISQGGISGTVADPKVIFKNAFLKNASGIILVHNHPSGNLKPSQEDIQLTKRMVRSGQELDLPILDHMIYSDNGHFSFADEGILTS